MGEILSKLKRHLFFNDFITRVMHSSIISFNWLTTITPSTHTHTHTYMNHTHSHTLFSCRSIIYQWYHNRIKCNQSEWHLAMNSTYQTVQVKSTDFWIVFFFLLFYLTLHAMRSIEQQIYFWETKRIRLAPINFNGTITRNKFINSLTYRYINYTDEKNCQLKQSA